MVESLRQGLKGEAAPGRASAKRNQYETLFSQKELDMKNQLKPFDLIVSSYGRDPMEGRPAPQTESKPVPGPGPLTESTVAPAEAPYRKFFPERMD